MLKNLFISILAFGLLGCSVRKDMKTMLESTKEMREKTSTMSEKTTQMNDRTEDFYRGGREDASIRAKDLAFEKVLEGNDGTVTRSVENAMIYFGALEFQHWQGDYEDTPERREELMGKAVELFFGDVDDLMDDDFPVTILNPYSQGYHNWVALSAMAAAMHKVHPYQEILTKKLGLKSYSMLDIIEEGLSRQAEANAGQPVPPYVKHVLEWKRQAIYLLQLRHNFIPVLMLGHMTKFEEGIFTRAGFFLKSWDLDLSFARNDLTLINFWNDWFERAGETRQFLKNELGINPEYNYLMERIFANNRSVIGLTDGRISLMSVGGPKTELAHNLIDICHVGGLKK